jgi:hypothetical protein
VLVGNLETAQTAICNPTADTWTAAGNVAARSDEESWTLLPDGTVLTVSCQNHPNAEKYGPSLNTWMSAGATPVELVQSSSLEIGPAQRRGLYVLRTPSRPSERRGAVFGAYHLCVRARRRTRSHLKTRHHQLSDQIDAGATYRVEGIQLNGRSQCCMFGDDAQQATNYPLVGARCLADESVRHWRTANPSTFGVATGSATVSTQVAVPWIAGGRYEVVVVANSIASDPVECEFPPLTWSGPATLTTVHGAVSITGHFSSGDRRDLVVAGTVARTIHETFWRPAQVGIEGEDDLPVTFTAGAIVSLGSMYNVDRQRHVVVVGTTAGKVHRNILESRHRRRRGPRRPARRVLPVEFRLRIDRGAFGILRFRS